MRLGENEQFAVLQEAWQLALELLKTQINKASYETWIKPIVPISYDGKMVVLGASSQFAKKWLETKHLKGIKSILESHLETDLVVNVILSESREAPILDDKLPKSKRKSDEELLSLPLNDRYTFDTFVVGPCNRLAHASCFAVAESPGKSYNPVFLYGGPGLGKTHLLHAIGRKIQQNKPNARVVYVSGETFTHHYITSLRERRNSEFRRKYRNVDVWLVDDIQFIAGKERTEEEFFHTYNALYETRKQIVLSSDRPPKDLQLDERLLSRFECGLVADIAEPDLETRMAILQQKALDENMTLPDDVILYIAKLIRSNIRALEGALVKLHAYASLMKMPVTSDLAADVLGRYFGEPKPYVLDPTAVQDAVCRRFSVSPAELNCARRTKELVLPRQVAMFLARELTSASLIAIGRAFGGRDHSTVLHACSKVRALRKVDAALAATLDELSKKLRNGDCS
ncbi:MAG: chromosomal replication initiator protein DnaA [Armatimonadota bacterium]|nr:chromosomal replication initiator protein DnaA [Armatimonadota bacterium]